MKTSIRFACAALAAALMSVPSLAGADDASKGVSFVAGSPSLPDVLAMAKKDGKPVFAEFQTPWCGWCRRIEKDVFAQPSVGALMKGFVSVSFDAEKGEGKGLAEKFRVRGFPTMVFLDADGAEIDRIEGFTSSDAFTKEVQRIQKGENTIPALEKQVAASPEDLAANLALARKLTLTAPAQAVTRLDAVLQNAKGKDRELEAEAWISLARAARSANDERRAQAASERVLADYADTQFAAEALQGAIPSKDPEAALVFLAKARKESKNPRMSGFADAIVTAIHLRSAAHALKRRAEAAGDDAQTLNEIAWTCFEHKMNLKAAVGWAKRAVDLSKRDPAILDTLANLQFATGRVDEAVTTEKDALAAAKDESMKAEFGETLAKFEAAVAFRAKHPVAAVPAQEDDDEEGESANEIETRGGALK